ncbi:hypothetical protein [Tabrizicola sp.]|uniref:hypothetical protein n=1 Tax=Tabrizicola sp. TaxID=2005166 RepID=UPI00286B8453|nr:hypothetical protein [Tabrizicola sp.]
MLLKIIIGLGVMLMLAGFGAAGIQYWQGLPDQGGVVAEASDPGAEPVEEDAATAKPKQTWLVSPTGGLVRRDDVLTYLAQERFVPSRTVAITRVVALQDLLVAGEKLPEQPYLQVLADIRAPMAATGACAVLLEELVADCAVQSARVVEDSVDLLAGTVRIRVELVFRLKPDAEELPDLSARAFSTDIVDLTFDAGTEGAGTVGDLLLSTVRAAQTACKAQKRTEACRVMRMDVTWEGDGAGTAQAVIGSLARLPKGMYPAPPLD